MFHHHGNEAHGPSQRLYGPWSQHQGHMHLTPLRPLSRPEGPHTVPLGRPQGLVEDAWLHGYAYALYGLWAPRGQPPGDDRTTRPDTARTKDRTGHIGRAHVRTPVTNAQTLCRLLLAT